MLVLAVAGLLVMHGLDAGAITHAGADATMTSTGGHAVSSEAAASAGAGHELAAQSQHSTASPDVPGRVAAGADDRTSRVTMNHLLAMCAVVLATVAAGVLRRLVARVRTRCAASVNPALVASPPPYRVFRPPRLRLAQLCILAC